MTSSFSPIHLTKYILGHRQHISHIRFRGWRLNIFNATRDVKSNANDGGITFVDILSLHTVTRVQPFGTTRNRWRQPTEQFINFMPHFVVPLLKICFVCLPSTNGIWSHAPGDTHNCILPTAKTNMQDVLPTCVYKFGYVDWMYNHTVVTDFFKSGKER